MTFRSSRSFVKAVLATLMLVGLAALVIWGFVEGRREAATERERERPVTSPTRVVTQGGQAIVSLDQAAQAQSGIVVAAIEAVSVEREVRAYGAVLDLLGLADLRNRYASAVAQVQGARARLEAARREHDRLTVLHEDNQNVSVKAVDAAEAAFRSEAANLDGATALVRALAANAGQQWGPAISRWVTEDAPALARLLDRDDVLIQVTLPPDVFLAPVPATALLQPGDGPRVQARQVSPAAHTDPRIQGASYLYMTSARADLVPGVNLAVFLPGGGSVAGAAIPESAVVWGQGKSWVYVEVVPWRFVRREVREVAGESGTYVAANLASGTRVVVRGAQALLSEEFRAQVQVGDEGGRR